MIGKLEDGFALAEFGKITCCASSKSANKLIGYPPEVLESFEKYEVLPDIILVEADGSAQKPLKIHLEHEPAIVRNAPVTCIVLGLSAYGKIFDAYTIHRVAECSDDIHIRLGGLITAPVLISLWERIKQRLREIQKKKKDLLTSDRKQNILILNQRDTVSCQVIEEISEYFSPDEIVFSTILKRETFHKNNTIRKFNKLSIERIVGQRKIGGIILAAGQAKRMGCIKQVLPWKKSTLVETAVDSAISSGLMPTVVVLGAHAEKIKPLLFEKSPWLYNSDYQSGMSSSLKVGIISMIQQKVDACFCMLVDQPLVDEILLNALMAEYIQQKPDILIPLYQGKRGNPVLLNKRVFPALLKISGNVGARAIFSNPDFYVLRVETGNIAVLKDVDTLDEYRDLSDQINC